MFGLDAYNQGDLLWLGNWSPTWLFVLALVGIGVIAISAYDLRSLAGYRRWTLVTLRALVYGLAVLMLLEPAIDLKDVTKIKNDVGVLVDTSRTMSLKTSGEETRFQRVRDALEAFESAEKRLSSEHEFHYFGFDESTDSSSRRALADAEPNGGASDLSGALEKMAEEFGTKSPGGFIVFSDGIDTGAIGRRVPRDENLDEQTKELLGELEGPINTVSAASDERIKDVAVSNVRHDDFAFVHNKTSVDVELQVVGMGETSFNVTLRRRGEVLQTREVRVSPEKTRYEVTFEFVPKQIGKEVYTVETPEFSGEALHDNNVSHFLLNVIRDKIRALQVVGRPSWDERFLRRLLKKNPNVDLISFFILRTNESVQLVPPSELSLIPFPTRELFEEQLGSFDLIIFQNFNFGPYDMDRYLGSIAEYVEDGGGFAMLGGDLSFASGGYSGTAIEEILPVRLPNSKMPEAVLDFRSYRPNLTDAGTRHPITQLAFDPQANRSIWQKLPKLRGTNIVEGAKPGATVLAEHPSIRRGGEKMPVLTVSEQGDGRVMALTSDSTWRWGFENVGQGGTPREYQVFWNSAMRWLIKDPELKLIQVDIPEEVYPPGEELEANVRLSNPDYTPAREAEGKLELHHRSFESVESEGAVRGGKQFASESFETDHNGEHSESFPVEKPGVYTVVASASTPAGELEDRDIALTVPDVEEFRQIVPREELMHRIAEETGGHAATLPDFDPADLNLEESTRVEVNRRRVIHLWDSAVVFGLILVLLGAEWILRRRWGRL